MRTNRTFRGGARFHAWAALFFWVPGLLVAFPLAQLNPVVGGAMCGLVGGLVPRAPRVAFEGSRIKVRNLSHPKVEGFSFFAKRYPVVIDAPQIDFVSSFADRHFYFTLIGGGKVTLDVARFLNAKERKELRYRVIAVRDAAAESKDSASRAG